jgi:hydrogenase/urease accessory protein HupE
MKHWIIILAALVSSLLLLAVAQAHEVRPAYLEITQPEASHYRIVWKQPTMGELAIRLSPHLSNGWLERQPDDQYAAAGFLIRTWNIEADTVDTLAGSTITIEGLEYTLTDVLLRIRLLNGPSVDALLRPESPQYQISSRDAPAVPMFLIHGIEHILAGADHLLFVLGLLLLVQGRWMLVKAVTAFTAAHSITLAMAVLAEASLPAPFVETLIALSILFLGVEILRARNGGTSLAIRYPWAMAFGFGLIHGMGFASGLASLGFAHGELLSALLLFNVGVELGQLTFIAIVLTVWRALSAARIGGPALQLRIPAYAVGIAGAYWTFQTGAKLLGVV